MFPSSSLEVFSDWCKAPLAASPGTPISAQSTQLYMAILILTTQWFLCATSPSPASALFLSEYCCLQPSLWIQGLHFIVLCIPRAWHGVGTQQTVVGWMSKLKNDQCNKERSCKWRAMEKHRCQKHCVSYLHIRKPFYSWYHLPHATIHC